MSRKEPLQIRMTIPCVSEFVGIVRLAVSGIATRMNFTVEEIEDIKIAVSEACTNAVQYAYGGKDGVGDIAILCNLHADRLEIVIQDSGKGFNLSDDMMNKKGAEDPIPDKLGLGLGMTFIKSLMDVADFKSEPGKGTTVRMVKKTPVKNAVK